MLIVRLKQCECAMADGRLDEAYELSRSGPLRADRRGQELVGRLARAFAERGGHHARCGRAAEASADCEKAAALAGNTPDVAALREAVERLRTDAVRAAEERRDARHLGEQALAAARQYAGMGQLTLCQGALEGPPEDARARAMKQDLAARRAALSAAVGAAAAALDAGDWEAALDRLAAARPGPAAGGDFGELAARVGRHVLARARDAVEAGRLDQAAGLLARLDRLGQPGVETEELRRTLRQCRAALELASGNEPRRAAEALRLLQPAWPGAGWLTKAIGRLEQLGTLTEEVRCGPLGLAALVPVPAGAGNFEETQPHPMALKAPVHLANMEHRRPHLPPGQQLPAAAARAGRPSGEAPQLPPLAPGSAPGRFLLQVDGAGSFPVVCRPVVTIGPEGGGPPGAAAPDVAVLADPATPRVTLSRADGDYFLHAATAVLVNDRPTTATLLNDGDKIALTPRCRLTFRRPNAASGTAALDLSGARLRRGDVRRILLADRDVLIGPGPHAHVRSDDLTAAAVLQPAGDARGEGNGQGAMILRAADPVQVDGRPAARPAWVRPGQHVRVGTVSFVISEA